MVCGNGWLVDGMTRHLEWQYLPPSHVPEADCIVILSGGSIGSELCRQIATYHPKHLLLLDRSEPNVFQIEQELIGLEYGQRIIPLVGDILDRARMEEIFSRFRPEVVFHAAAHKHVPMMEHQPGEAIQKMCIRDRESDAISRTSFS